MHIINYHHIHLHEIVQKALKQRQNQTFPPKGFFAKAHGTSQWHLTREAPVRNIG